MNKVVAILLFSFFYVATTISPSVANDFPQIDGDQAEGRLLLDFLEADTKNARSNGFSTTDIRKHYAQCAAYGTIAGQCIKNIDKEKSEEFSIFADIFLALSAHLSDQGTAMDIFSKEYLLMHGTGDSCDRLEALDKEFGSAFIQKVDTIKILYDRFLPLIQKKMDSERENKSQDEVKNYAKEESKTGQAADADVKKSTESAIALIQSLPVFIGLFVAIFTLFRKEDPKPSGFAGWLLFFILTGIFVFPFHALRELSTMPDEITTCLYVLYIILFYYALYALAGVKPYAVKLIKAILIINPILAFLLPAVATVSMLIKSNNIAMLLPSLHDAYNLPTLIFLIPHIVYSAIWYAYFCKSVRVKNTWNRKKQRETIDISPITRAS